MGERLTQAAIEALASGSPNARLTQAAIECVIPNHSQLGAVQPLSECFPFMEPYVPGGIRGLAYPIMKSPESSTSVFTGSNAYSVRLANYRNPVWHWTLIFNYLKDNPNDVPALYAPYTDYARLAGFFVRMDGRARPFLFFDPNDNFVGPALQNSSWSANWAPIVNAIIVVSGNAWQATTVTGPTGWSLPAFGGSSQADGGVTWTKIGAASGDEPNAHAQLQFLTDGDYWYSPLQRAFGQFLEDITDLNTWTRVGGSPLLVYANGTLLQSAAYQVLGPEEQTIDGEKFFGAYLRFTAWTPFASISTGDDYIDPAGHIQQATNNGTAGTLSPAWNDAGGETLDGTAVWQDLGPAAPITVSFNFFFRATFESDEADFEQFLYQVWTAGGPDTKNGAGYLKLMTARPTMNPPRPSCAEVYPWNP
jgi:hypothetical protein